MKGQDNRGRSVHRSKDELEVLKAPLITDPQSGKTDYLKLQARLVRAFGPAAGILCRELVFLTGRSKLEDGWVYNSRDAWRARTGLGHRALEKARAILRGDRPWAGKTHEVLEERRPSRRAPTEYRLDLVAVAGVLGVDMSPTEDELGYLFEGLDDACVDEALEGAHESRRGATNDGSGDTTGIGEAPYETTESPRSASHSPHGATELPYTGPLQRKQQRVSRKVRAEAHPSVCAEAAGAAPAPRRSIQMEQWKASGFGTSGTVIEQQGQDRERKGGETAAADDAFPLPEHPQHPQLSGQRKSQVWRLMEPLENDPENPVSRLTARHMQVGGDVEDQLVTVAQIAEKVRETLGTNEPLDAYATTVTDVLRLMAAETNP
jgi:hypothetical protein